MFDFQDFGFDSASDGSADASPPSTGPYIPEASECMRCGMCVSTCPTFRLFQVDEQTPRRRVRTIAKILADDAGVGVEELAQLNDCVQCRTCETVCPSRMSYGTLFDRAQAKLRATARPSWLARLGLRLIERKHARALLLPFVTLYLRSGLQKPLRASGLLAKLGLGAAEALVCEPSLVGLAGIYPVERRIKYRGRVALFTGCLAEHFDRPVQVAGIKLLNRLGYEVVVPEEQGCCGAIHQHNGLPAESMMEANIAAFYALEVEAVIYSASGCGAMLTEYQGGDSETSGWFTKHLIDINEFLLAHWPEDLQLAASNLNVAVHEPCSQRNVLKNSQSVYALLRKIPGVNLEALADNQLCCGAGGTYMLSHPENAKSLRAAKRLAMAGSGADVVVSANFGCGFYLNAGQPAGSRVLHPLQLLADRI